MAFLSNPYYTVVTIDHTLVGGALTDFVLYINGLPSDAYTKMHSTGKDIRVSNGTGTTELAFDLRAIETNPLAGELIEMMVKVPSVSAVTDTEIRIWYGDHSLTAYDPTDPYGRNAVYSLFEVVHSLSENLSGATGTTIYIDRTGNGNSGSDYADATGKAGKVGSGQEFDGSNDYLSIPSSNFQAQTEGTIVCWVYPHVADTTAIFNHGAATGQADLSIFEIVNTNNVIYQPRWFLKTGNVVRHNIKANISAVSLNTWHHVALTVNSSGVRMEFDGVTASLLTYAGSASNTQFFDDMGTNANHTRIGVHRFDGVDYRFLDGNLDELWISSSALSAEYIETLYNSQNAAFNTFYTASAVQTAFIPIICWF